MRTPEITGAWSSVPLIRAAGLRVAARFLGQVGAPVTRMLERARLDPSLVERPEAVVPLRPLQQFVADAAKREGIPDLGARIALATEFEDLGQFGRLVTRACTLHEALRTAAAIYPHYSSSERIWTAAGRLGARCHHAWDRRVHDAGQLGGMSIAFLLNLARRAGGTRWRATRIIVQAAADPTYRRDGVFGDVPVDFSPEFGAVVMSEKDLSMPLTSLRPATPDATWPAEGPAPDFEGSLRQVVTSLLPSGYPDLHLVAEVAGTSARTAQRRLAEAGTSYARIVDEARFALAQRLLADPDQKVIDVALELGYSDPAHFTRAFRRWTGTTPRAFRRDHLGVP
jgi:AraC-like DNA-binding protein